MKNITLSAPEELIEEARLQAAQKGTTLNQEFRTWLGDKTQKSPRQRVKELDSLFKELSYARTGGPFTRDEMNER